MNSDTRNARVAGILLLVALAAGIASLPFYSPAKESDYLVLAAANDTRLTIAMLLELIMAFACAGIAIFLYPTLKKWDQAMALGAVGFRVIEAALFAAATAGLFSILTLSREYVKAGMPTDPAYYQTFGTVLFSMRDWADYVAGALAFGLGALLYYIIFYRSRLIPRWLAGWGLVAIVMHIASALLVMFGASPMSAATALLNLPIALNELVLAFWLIGKGYDRSVLAGLQAGR